MSLPLPPKNVSGYVPTFVTAPTTNISYSFKSFNQ